MTNKLTLIEKIIHTQNDVLLQYIEELLENEVAKEYWSQIPAHQQRIIQEGMEEADRGEFISDVEVKESIQSLLKNAAKK